MADVKISALPLATTPLAGTEVLPIVQSATTDQVSVANLTAGRAVSAASLTLTTTPLAVGSGGTGLTSLTAGYIPYGNGTGAFGNNANFSYDGSNLIAPNLLVNETSNPGAFNNGIYVSSGTNRYVGFQLYNNSTKAAGGVNFSLDNTTGAAGFTNSISGGYLNFSSYNYINFTATGGSEVMRIVTSGTGAGNLGLGVTPSAWSGATALQLAGSGFIASNNQYLEISTNTYYNSGYKYIGTGLATEYSQQAGAHVWKTAASGSAGGTITFTQAMTLDASGRLTIGNLTLSSTEGPFNVSINGIGFHLGYSSNYDNYFTCGASGIQVFRTGTTERARIDSSGNLLVGTTSAIGAGPQINVCGPTTNRSYIILSRATAATTGVCGSLQGYNGSSVIASIDFKSNGANNSGYIATYTWSAGSAVQGPYVNTGGTSWTTPSDENLKNILAPITGALDKVLRLKSIYYALKADSTQAHRVGFTAQNMQTVLPEVVSAKADGELGVDYAATTPLLAAAIQELAAKVQALEAKVA